jgi:hypothetical protein
MGRRFSLQNAARQGLSCARGGAEMNVAIGTDQPPQPVHRARLGTVDALGPFRIRRGSAPR